MKVIFNPTDFSDKAWKATVIAHKIAALSQGKLVLMHAYHMPSAEAGFNYDPETSVKVKQEIEEKLDKLISKLIEEDPSAEVEFEKVVRYGYASDEIVGACQNVQSDMIVMKTGGAHGMVGKVIGSVTGKIVERAKCPVLAVPKEYEGVGFNNIVYASTLKDEPEKLINTVVNFGKLFNSSITILHVTENESEDVDKEGIEYAVKNNLGQKGYDKLSIQFIKNKNIVDGITEFAVKEKADLIVMARKNRSFWEGVFNKSKTEKMSFKTRIPLLALRRKD